MKKLIMLCLLSFFFLYGSAFGAFNFIDNGDGTVTDARTGLIWLKNANPWGIINWYDARTHCASLASGQAGLIDGSIAGQWRLPTKTELEGIGTDPPATWEQYYPFVTWTMPGAPFTGVQFSHGYWSGTSEDDDYAWYVFINVGYVHYDYYGKINGIFAWPVRNLITLIQLENFTAHAGNKKITLNWLTGSEIDNAGFNIHRSESENGEYIQINKVLIPAEGSATQGASYTFTDDGLQNRKAYWYKLEDIDLNGTLTMHGPVKATPRLIYGVGQVVAEPLAALALIGFFICRSGDGWSGR